MTLKIIPHPEEAAEQPSRRTHGALALQRGDGAVEIGFVRRGAATVLSHLYQRTPCRAMFPRAETGEPALAVLLTTSGGLAGGDRLALSIGAEAGAAATVTTAAAEKIYRSLGADAAIAIALDVGEGAWLEWLPQETILFDRARLRRGITAKVAPTGRLLAADMLVFGRVARGERFAEGGLREHWRIERGGVLAWVDALRLDGDVAAPLAHPAGFGGAEAFATLAYVGADAERYLPVARDRAAQSGGRAGATLINGILLVRFLGPAMAVRAGLARCVAGLRHAAAGLTEQTPRSWRI